MIRFLTHLWNLWAPAGAPPSAVVLCSAAVGTLHDEYDDAAGITSYALGFNQEKVAQSWQSGPSPTEVSGACFQLQRVGSPTGTFVVTIKAHSGTYGTSSVPSGGALVASATFAADGVSTDAAGTLYFFEVAGWTPDPSVNYTLEIDGSNLSGDVSNNLGVKADAVGASHSGNLALDNGGGYAAQGGQDLLFKIYYVGGGGPDNEIAHHMKRRRVRRRRFWMIAFLILMAS